MSNVPGSHSLKPGLWRHAPGNWQKIKQVIIYNYIHVHVYGRDALLTLWVASVQAVRDGAELVGIPLASAINELPACFSIRVIVEGRNGSSAGPGVRWEVTDVDTEGESASDKSTF